VQCERARVKSENEGGRQDSADFTIFWNETRAGALKKKKGYKH